MTYPDSFEHKTGFDAVRRRLGELCVTAPGRDLVAAMDFSTDASEVRRRLDATAEMAAIRRADAPFSLGGFHDVAPMLARARVEGTYIAAEELPALRRTLEAFDSVARFFRNARDPETGATPYPVLTETAASLAPFPDALKAIAKVIDPVGAILDNASPELAQIRRELSRISGTVNSILRRVMAQAVQSGYLEADAAPSVRDGRLVIPVSPMNKRKIQGIVHDESASGKTYFIEPAEVVEVNNRARELEMDERREVVHILRELTSRLRPDFPAMAESAAVMASLDFVQAKALFADETGGTLPSLADHPELEWYHAVHPVLLASLTKQGKEIVPLDITLTPAARLLVISGPNAGGKSVTLKTVGIIQYMTQCGLLPTVYENSRMGLFDDIFIDIGDDQSIENDLSTYSSHLRNMRFFLDNGRRSTLILIDEFGGGTEPQIGGAIAQAILSEFNGREMWGVITTHYQNLKHLADETPGLVNGSMLYDRQQMRPLFRLSIGNAGSSFALEIARKTGLPAQIIDKAKEIVGSDYVNMDKYLLDIARDRRYWAEKRQAIRQKEKRLDDTLERYRDDAETLRASRRDIIADAREEARKILEGSNASVERAIREIRESQAEKERTLEARRRLEAEKSDLLADRPATNALLDKAPRPKRQKAEPKMAEAQKRPLEVGDFVKLDNQGTPGRVLEIDGKNVTVGFGMLKTTVKANRLTLTLQRPQSGAREAASFLTAGTTNAMREKQLSFSREIDVRGFRADEAIQAVTYFLDDAVQFSQGQVRILHGTGTGALRQAIRQYLDSVPSVASYRDEDVRFGGAGITVVSLA